METPNDEIQTIQAENQALRQKVAALQSLRDMARALTLELNLRPLLYMIMDSAADLLGASACTLLLHEGEARAGL